MRKGEIEGSPAYTLENAGVIAGGAFETIDCQTQANRIRRWLPFDSVELNNASTVNVDVYVNGSSKRRIFVSGGGSKVYSDAAIYSVRIKNRSDATDIAIGDIVATFMKERIGADKGVYKVAKGVFGWMTK